MTFRDFSAFLQKLEQTASRNAMTEILADLFKKADSKEIDKMCYLLLGRLAPKFTSIEFQFAEKLMIKTIARVYNLPEEQIKAKFKKAGDLGNVVNNLKFKIAKGKSEDKNLSIVQVYEKLLVLAQEEGQGSVERKIVHMSDLLKTLDPLSAKYAVRMVLGVLRVGFSDMTILDGLSWMKKGDKSLRKDLESAYNNSTDIGLIAKIFKKGGLKEIEKITVIPGIPIRPQQSERLETAEKIIEKLGKCAIEYKLDGLRCVDGYTGVYLKGKGFTVVRDVAVGDCVLTHRGRYRKIIKKYKRTIKKKENLYKFQTYFGDEFKISEGHKILCWMGKQEWIPVEKINPGDELVFPIPRVDNNKNLPDQIEFSNKSGYKKTIKLNKDFFRFLGFWIGDGFTNNYHASERIGLHFNEKKEKKLSKVYEKIIRETLKIIEISKYSHSGVLTLYWRDKPFREWLTKYFRREWKGKILPLWFANINKEMFKEFLKGWIESDGSERIHGGFDIVTKERDLASFVQILGLQFGILLGLRRIRHEIKDHKFIRTYYHLLIPKTNRKIKFLKDKILVKVLKVKKIKRDPRQVLYNFEVEDDESYCTSLASLHNCQVHVLNSNVKTQMSKLRRKQEQLFLGQKRDEKRIMLFSRNLENTTHMFPEVVEAAKKLHIDSAVLDGEIIGIDPKKGTFLPFQQTAQRKRKHDIAEMAKKVPVKFFAFDILYLNGKSLLHKSFRERRRILEQVLK